jgi:hypothetical protein
VNSCAGGCRNVVMVGFRREPGFPRQPFNPGQWRDVTAIDLAQTGYHDRGARAWFAIIKRI